MTTTRPVPSAPATHRGETFRRLAGLPWMRIAVHRRDRPGRLHRLGLGRAVRGRVGRAAGPGECPAARRAGPPDGRLRLAGHRRLDGSLGHAVAGRGRWGPARARVRPGGCGPAARAGPPLGPDLARVDAVPAVPCRAAPLGALGGHRPRGGHDHLLRLHGRGHGLGTAARSQPIPPVRRTGPAGLALPESFFWISVPAYLAWGLGLVVASCAYARRTTPRAVPAP